MISCPVSSPWGGYQMSLKMSTKVLIINAGHACRGLSAPLLCCRRPARAACDPLFCMCRPVMVLPSVSASHATPDHGRRPPSLAYLQPRMAAAGLIIPDYARAGLRTASPTRVLPLKTCFGHACPAMIIMRRMAEPASRPRHVPARGRLCPISLVFAV